MRTPTQVLTDWTIRMLVKDSKSYIQHFPNDMERLRAVIRPGDVLLVEGSQRVSEIIKYMTQSSWSHAALYVGDALLKRSPAEAVRAREQFGAEAATMLIEANVETGVCAVPLSKYQRHNIRICRAMKLRPGDLNTVLNTVINQIGTAYSVAQMRGLLRYFFPLSLIPRRFRRVALERSGDFSREVICSSQIAQAFQKVRYPILARIVADNETARRRRALRRWLPRILGGSRTPTVFERSIFSPCDPMFVTPRDFDLSPYFEIVKPSIAASSDFDYKLLNWLEPPVEPPSIVRTPPQHEELPDEQSEEEAEIASDTTG